MSDLGKKPVGAQGPGADVPDPDAVGEALDRIVNSPEFAGAERIQSLLRYVVREEVEGRGALIRGKTVLEDVYGRSPRSGNDPIAVVRVDAGRLRRRLADYYSGSGKTDLLHIRINPGGYTPVFQRFQPGPETAPNTGAGTPGRHRAAIAALAGVLIFVLLGIGIWLSVPAPQPGPAPVTADRQGAPEMAVREALFSESPARLQAANIAVRARELLFPALEPEWQRIVLDMFELAIRLDPNYFGGYAGAAQAEAIVSLSLPPGDDRAAHLARAATRAARAKELGIDQGWTHSASAMVAFAGRDFETAVSDSRRALVLDPRDLNVINSDALFALFSGDFDRAIAQAEATRARGTPASRFPSLSVMAAAHLHQGNPAAALALLNEAALSGDPISPISLGYMIAAQVGLGNRPAARELLDLLDDAWPGYPMDALYHALYRDRTHAGQIVSALRAAGWTAGPGNPQD